MDHSTAVLAYEIWQNTPAGVDNSAERNWFQAQAFLQTPGIDQVISIVAHARWLSLGKPEGTASQDWDAARWRVYVMWTQGDDLSEVLV